MCPMSLPVSLHCLRVLCGYWQHHTPLTSDQVFEDVMQDYANRTVTFETNPHQPAAGLHAAIHPCRHAETMKRIIDHVADGGQQVRVDQYLFVFLKYVGAHGYHSSSEAPADTCACAGSSSRLCLPSTTTTRCPWQPNSRLLQ